ncbi:MAG: bifunctional UDP-N-acetylglucosamine diphosphorylase/glucosamine-1-phosphate N-acetyltransferase GlmU [Anaerolineales bacterium]
MRCESLVLAAGLGTRMKSEVPKVLHPLGGRAMLTWVVEACKYATGRPPFVVVPPETHQAIEAAGEQVECIVQEERLGTAHAVMQAREALQGRSDLLLVAYSDMPLLRGETLRSLLRAQETNPGPFTLLTMHSAHSRGFGRIQRDENGQVVGIVEEAHATAEQLAIQELNVGAYCFRSDWLWDRLPSLQLSPKGEYYLTDLVSLAAKESVAVGSIQVVDQDEVIGINTREHLAQAEAALRRRINRHWMREGVTLLDPATTYIGPAVQIGQDSVVLPNTHLEGGTVVGRTCRLGPNTVVRDSTIGDRCSVVASVVEEARLDEEVHIGPFAHLRRGAHLCRGVHMGNFGEVKNSTLGPGVRMGHFSYVGDATIGPGANVGAGTVTCNYDGKQKHRTEIEEGAFIGSDTMLVAPVRIGRGSRTGAGSVVTRDVPDWSVAAGVPARVIRRLKESDE